MSSTTKPLVVDLNGKPSPQYYNSTNDLYEVVKGENGAIYIKPIATIDTSVVNPLPAGTNIIGKVDINSIPEVEIKNDSGNPLKINITNNRIKEYFSGSSTVTHIFAQTMYGFFISNDGSNNLTFTINGITITVQPGERFDDVFEAFTTVIVTSNNVAFRAWGRG